jgi:hypothetical protein
MHDLFAVEDFNITAPRWEALVGGWAAVVLSFINLDLISIAPRHIIVIIVSRRMSIESIFLVSTCTVYSIYFMLSSILVLSNLDTL